MPIINLISGPRNISTALMYSFAQREDTLVLDEPFYGNYLSRFNVDHPGKEEIIASMLLDFDKILADIFEKQQQSEVVFIKNMAHHLIEMDLGFLRNMTNMFLIRDPKQLIASFAQVIPNPTMQDIGVKRQTELFEFIKSFQQEVPVVDSSEVLENPEKVLKELCQKLGLPFTAKMLSWDPNKSVVDVPWAKYWYANVQKSSGFEKQPSSNRELPKHCEPLYLEAIPLYEKMYQHAIKA